MTPGVAGEALRDPVQRLDAPLRRVHAIRQRQASREHVEAVVPDVGAEQPDEAADQQDGADQQHARECDLHRHDRRARARRMGSHARANGRERIVGQRWNEILPRRLDRRQQAESDAGDEGDGHRKELHSCVERDVLEARKVRRQQRRQRRVQRRRERQIPRTHRADRAADSRSGIDARAGPTRHPAPIGSPARGA